MLLYGATLWSITFPLGMCDVAAHYLEQADSLPIVRVIGEVCPGLRWEPGRRCSWQ